MLNDTFGIEKGYMTTIHSYTGDQPTLDTAHKDLHRARAAAVSMIPTSTGAAKAVGLVLPDLLGKLNGSAIRVPTPNVSCVDLKFMAGRNTSTDEVNAALKAASENELKGVLGYCEEPLVSVDYNHDQHSSSVAAKNVGSIADLPPLPYLTRHEIEDCENACMQLRILQAQQCPSLVPT